MTKSNIALHIVKTAGNLFYANGYNSTGINEIIEKAAIAKATLYGHFKSKEDICITYLELRHTEFIAALKNYIDSRVLGAPQLLAIYDLLLENYREKGFHGCWGIKIYGELPSDNDKIKAVIQQQKKDLLLFLGELVRRNFINVSNAEVEKISGGIYLLYESAITESHLHQADWPIHLAKKMAISLFQGMQMVQKSPGY
ncbi:TetR/AcrR family transcriptional regulator [Allomuricauda sp. d1]|uniref:TetR/AcrR family transcriptional regulator n=1 Tax=Allomuricauda sp. d1 TaxID=3136725 RepID=UPI0031DF400F